MTKHYLVLVSNSFTGAIDVALKESERVLPQNKFITLIRVTREDGQDYYQEDNHLTLDDESKYIRDILCNPYEQEARSGVAIAFNYGGIPHLQELRAIRLWAEITEAKILDNSLNPETFDILKDSFREYKFEQDGVTNIVPDKEDQKYGEAVYVVAFKVIDKF